MIFSEWGILESITPPEAGMGETEMDLSNQEYDALVRGKAQPSPLWKDLAWAFCVGGGICAVGQGLLEWYQSLGMEREQAGTAVSVTLILAAALLTGLGLFANAMVSPALEFKSEGLITGTAAKLFVVAGPVLVFGISASVVYGLILLLLGQG